MLTRPKLILPFQIARAMVSSVQSPPQAVRNARCMPRRNRYGYDSLPPAPVRSAPASIVSNFDRLRHQRGALAAAPALLLADRSRLRPAAVDRLRGVVP